MLHTLCFSLQNAIYFIMLPFLVPVLFTFYIHAWRTWFCKCAFLPYGHSAFYPQRFGPPGFGATNAVNFVKTGPSKAVYCEYVVAGYFIIFFFFWAMHQDSLSVLIRYKLCYQVSYFIQLNAQLGYSRLKLTLKFTQ